MEQVLNFIVPRVEVCQKDYYFVLKYFLAGGELEFAVYCVRTIKIADTSEYKHIINVEEYEYNSDEIYYLHIPLASTVFEVIDRNSRSSFALLDLIEEFYKFFVKNSVDKIVRLQNGFQSEYEITINK